MWHDIAWQHHHCNVAYHNAIPQRLTAGVREPWRAVSGRDEKYVCAMLQMCCVCVSLRAEGHCCQPIGVGEY
jgi:hypothetical protein